MISTNEHMVSWSVHRYSIDTQFDKLLSFIWIALTPKLHAQTPGTSTFEVKVWALLDFYQAYPCPSYLVVASTLLMPHLGFNVHFIWCVGLCTSSSVASWHLFFLVVMWLDWRHLKVIVLSISMWGGSQPILFIVWLWYITSLANVIIGTWEPTWEPWLYLQNIIRCFSI